MAGYFSFNHEAALETILYLASRVHEPTMHRIAKLLYFADKMHLEEYGRFICGDTYVAMDHGPVPSQVYDMLKAARDHGAYAEQFKVRRGYVVEPQREADLEWLSESAVECLEAAIMRYDRMTFGEISDASHDEAWQKAEENGPIDLLDIVAMLDDAEALSEHLLDQHPG